MAILSVRPRSKYMSGVNKVKERIRVPWGGSLFLLTVVSLHKALWNIANKFAYPHFLLNRSYCFPLLQTHALCAERPQKINVCSLVNGGDPQGIVVGMGCPSMNVLITPTLPLFPNRGQANVSTSFQESFVVIH